MVTHPQTGLIHIAGVIDRAEADMLIACGATHLGFPLVLGHHKEDLTPEAAAVIVSEFEARAEFFLITYLKRAVDIIELCELLKVGGVQLHDDITHDEIAKLRASAPWLHVIKSIIIRAGATAQADEMVELYSPHVDAFITDTHDPETGATGATGKIHDWAVSRRIVGMSPRPVILAGGLNADNVFDAINQVRPAGVDVHTGIEDIDGRKERNKTLRFIAQAQHSFASLEPVQATMPRS